MAKIESLKESDTFVPSSTISMFVPLNHARSMSKSTLPGGIARAL
eukprot:CAMPEP_0115141682 /NCGR_PEP_ID=MMETSP0227-20121206/59689_1 /TAXON_ID=89957 /ORGANISM="Polarella glacialis, Strain CCMP 1383" /LENGTH=44 /DNA_ID= /DNA_START= /DNA_END= /DNA_ORIENTATION=